MVEVAQPRIDVIDPPDPLDRVEAVAIVLHGGREKSTAAVTPGQLTVRRMRPFARELAAAGGNDGLAVWSLQYRVRGWNGTERSPVADVQWALDQVGRRLGDVPVVLVGHSMGARAAIHVAGDRRVVAIVALAPWLPRGEPYEQIAGRAVLVVHGQLDTITSPRGSLEWARQAATVTDRIWRVEVRRERHAMLWRAALWHRLATQFTSAALGFGRLPEVLTNAPPGQRLEIRV